MINIKNNSRITGLIYSFAGILLMSFDSLLIRLAGTSGWNIAFYRGFFIFIIIGILFLRQNRKDFKKVINDGGRILLLSSFLWASSSILFVQGVKLTSAANVLVLLSLSPVFAAVISFFILKEIISARIWGSIFVSIVGIVIMFSGDIKAGNIVGNIISLFLPVCLALNLTIMRKYQKISKTAAIAFGGFIAAMVSIPFAAPLAISGLSLFYLVLLGFVVMPFSQLLISMGTKYISSPEVGLIMMSEAFLGPLWIWIVLNDLPAKNTFIGGSLILTAMVVNSVFSLKGQKRTCC